jgi:uncharacterized protein YbjQ (UPF0145 family)
MLITTTPGSRAAPWPSTSASSPPRACSGVNAFKDIGAGMRNIFGGRAKSYENELASGVSDAWPSWSSRRPAWAPTPWLAWTSTTRPWATTC